MRRLVIVLLAALLGGPAVAQTSLPEANPSLKPGQGQVAPRRKAPPRIGDDLVGTRWRAETLQGKPLPQAATLTLEFLDDGYVRGETDCDRYVGPYATRASKGVFGPFSRTLSDCPPAAAEHADRLIDVLSHAGRMELREKGKVLLIHASGAGQPSRFARLP